MRVALSPQPRQVAARLRQRGEELDQQIRLLGVEAGVAQIVAPALKAVGKWAISR